MPHPSVSAAYTTAVAELPRIHDHARALFSDIQKLLALSGRAAQTVQTIALALVTLEVARTRASTASAWPHLDDSTMPPKG